MSPKAQGTNRRILNGFGKRATRTFKRFLGMKVSNNKKTNPTQAHAMETNNTQKNRLSQRSTPYPVLLGTFNHAAQKVYLFGKYQFYFNITDKNTYLCLIDEIGADGNVTNRNILPQDMVIPTGKKYNEAVNAFNELKKGLIEKIDTNMNTIINCSDIEYKQYLAYINQINRATGYSTESYIPVSEQTSRSNTTFETQEIEPAPTIKKGRLISRVTKRIKRARNVLYLGVRRAGRGAVRGAKWIGAQTKKKLTAFVNFFTTIFGKFDNFAERNASGLGNEEENYVLVTKPQVQYSHNSGMRRSQPVSTSRPMRNNTSATTLAEKIKTKHESVDGSVTVENTVTINLYKLFKIVITQNTTGDYDFAFRVYVAVDEQFSDIDQILTYLLEATKQDTLTTDSIKLLGAQLKNTYTKYTNTYTKTDFHKFNADNTGANIDKFATTIHGIGRLLDAYNESIQQTKL